MRLRHRALHRAIWATLALLLPGILIGGLALRLLAPPAEPPVRIAPP
jgi:hypothetical protein